MTTQTQSTDLPKTFTVPERTLNIADVLKAKLIVLTGVGDNGEWYMATVNKSSRYDDELIWALKALGCKEVHCASKK